MILGIAEDFTMDVNLDSQLTASDSGLFVNSGVHPIITLENLLYFLPNYQTITQVWSASTTYGKFEDSRKKSDLVLYRNTIYQSLQASNIGNSPSDSPAYWLETNLESLRLKNLIYQVIDKVKTELKLNRTLVNNQFIYEQGDNEVTLPNDYAAWVFEPKGSDYVSMKINQIAIQADGTDPIDVYVVNQGTLQETVSVAPNNGEIAFRDVDITLSGKGKFKLVIDSQSVYTKGYYVDPLRYDGFVCYTATGTGDAPETASYSYGTAGNGIGLNISAYLDAGLYIDNNLVNLGNFVRATFEYVVFNMFLHNANNRSNRAQRLMLDDQKLLIECKTFDADTVCKRFYDERKRAMGQLGKTFDTQLRGDDNIQFEVTGL